MFDAADGLYGIAEAIAAKVSEWIVTLRARRRMGKSLGKIPSDLELAFAQNLDEGGRSRAAGKREWPNSSTLKKR
jgi:hypothetical protein